MDDIAIDQIRDLCRQVAGGANLVLWYKAFGDQGYTELLPEVVEIDGEPCLRFAGPPFHHIALWGCEPGDVFVSTKPVPVESPHLTFQGGRGNDEP